MAEPTSAVAIAGQSTPLASTQLAAYLGIEKGMMIETIKRQCFKGLTPDQVTDAQLASFISVASHYKVNVMLPGFLYCYPERNGGIQVMIGPDLVFKLLTEHPQIESWETTAFPEDVTHPPTHAVTKIFRKNVERPIIYIAVLSEWKVSSNPNWVTRPRHMLALRSLKQAARQVIHGLPYDEDDRVIMAAGAIDVTPDSATSEQQQQPARERAPRKSTKGIAAVPETPPPADQKAAAKSNGPEVAGELVEEKAPEQPATPAAATEAPKTEAAKSRAFLKDAEVVECICTVKDIHPLSITKDKVVHKSVQANLAGDFFGTAYHIGGDGNPAWQLEKPVRIKLRGQLNPKAGGKVQVFVDSISLADDGGTGMEV